MGVVQYDNIKNMTNQLPTPALPGSGMRDLRDAQSQPEFQRPCVRLFCSHAYYSGKRAARQALFAKRARIWFLAHAHAAQQAAENIPPCEPCDSLRRDERKLCNDAVSGAHGERAEALPFSTGAVTAGSTETSEESWAASDLSIRTGFASRRTGVTASSWPRTTGTDGIWTSAGGCASA